MGEMFIRKADSPWDLQVVENYGTVPSENVDKEFVIEIGPLLTDVKSKLLTVPRSLVYTIGWRAVVWKNEKTGQFLDLTEEEFQSYADGGIVTFTRENGTVATEDESSEGDSTSTAE